MTIQYSLVISVKNYFPLHTKIQIWTPWKQSRQVPWKLVLQRKVGRPRAVWGFVGCQGQIKGSKRHEAPTSLISSSGWNPGVGGPPTVAMSDGPGGEVQYCKQHTSVCSTAFTLECPQPCLQTAKKTNFSWAWWHTPVSQHLRQREGWSLTS